MSTALTPSVLLLASRDYINTRIVFDVVATLPIATILHVASARNGAGHALLKSSFTSSFDIRPMRWQPTRPDCLPSAERALIFWDGQPELSLLRSLAVLRRHRIALTIYDLDGNTLDLQTFCARLTHNGRNGHTKMTTRPATIVDAPPIAPGESAARNGTKVRLHIHVPEAVVEQYELQARAAGVSLEKVCSDRLRTCVQHTSGRGLYFTDAERSDLERITGGHAVNDAATALTRIRATVTLQVGGVTIEISDRVLARCASRAKSVRKSLDEYVRQEVVQGLERSVGLRPW